MSSGGKLWYRTWERLFSIPCAIATALVGSCASRGVTGKPWSVIRKHCPSRSSRSWREFFQMSLAARSVMDEHCVRSISIKGGHLETSSEMDTEVTSSNSQSLMRRRQGQLRASARIPSSVIFLQPSRLTPCSLGEVAAKTAIVLSVTSQTFVRSSATRLEVHESTAINASSVRRSHPLRVKRSRRVHAARTAKRVSSSSRETEEKLSLRINEAYANVVS